MGWLYRYKSKKKAFTKYAKKDDASIDEELNRLKQYASSIRVLVHTQPKKAPGIKQKKAHLMEIQVWLVLHVASAWLEDFLTQLPYRLTVAPLRTRSTSPRACLSRRCPWTLSSRRTR